MNIQVSDVDDITIIAIDGMVTIGSDQKLADTFREQIARNRHQIVLDMTRVKYIDSLGIGQIAGGYTSLDEVGGQLVLARTNTKIKELLRLTGLQNHIKTFDTVEDAIQAL
ncbi:Anti-sigma factor antagonist [Sulfidibacter corallicola]|uniref:Anti-sigma factor antagonist n=1 Tax=Sulfidibacter corallicola TaxID=2818388 RepID=A0A8A4THA2_SULCO|nr:STAS domain-containing protein [Sulfidibacter corallicola]QTD48118.1 STAS domain-containing protein [Sulfidibacter corallicola]